jgi:hypothetical protein
MRINILSLWHTNKQKTMRTIHVLRITLLILAISLFETVGFLCLIKHDFWGAIIFASLCVITFLVVFSIFMSALKDYDGKFINILKFWR